MCDRNCFSVTLVEGYLSSPNLWYINTDTPGSEKAGEEYKKKSIINKKWLLLRLVKKK